MMRPENETPKRLECVASYPVDAGYAIPLEIHAATGRVFCRTFNRQNNGRFVVFDYRSGETTLVTHKLGAEYDGSTLSPDGTKIVSWKGGRQIYVWDPRTELELNVFNYLGDELLGLRWLPDSRRFVSFARDCEIWLWDSTRGLIGVSKSQFIPSVMATSMDGSRAVTGDVAGYLFLWDLPGRNFLRILPPLEEMPPIYGMLDNPVFASAHSLCFFPDGRRIAVGKGDSSFTVIDTIDAKELARHKVFADDSKKVNTIDVSPNGRRILCGIEGGRAQLWDWQAGKLIGILDHPSERVRPDQPETDGGVLQVAFTPDGLNAVTGSRDGIVRIWKLPP